MGRIVEFDDQDRAEFVARAQGEIHMLGLDAVQPSPRDALMLFSEQLGLPVGCSLRNVNEDRKSVV